MRKILLLFLNNHEDTGRSGDTTPSIVKFGNWKRWSVLNPAKETARTAKSILPLQTSLFISPYRYAVGRVAWSVQRLATSSTVRGLNPGGGKIFRCPDRPWGPPCLLYNGCRVFPGVKERPERDADPSPPSSAVVKKEQSYTSTPPVPYDLYRASVPVQECTLICLSTIYQYSTIIGYLVRQATRYSCGLTL